MSCSWAASIVIVNETLLVLSKSARFWVSMLANAIGARQPSLARAPAQWVAAVKHWSALLAQAEESASRGQGGWRRQRGSRPADRRRPGETGRSWADGKSLVKHWAGNAGPSPTSDDLDVTVDGPEPGGP